MNLADKIMILRKRAGWSQEELAEKLEVSRQAVSKWEATQSVPDLDRILRMSELFGVSTDVLLKDSEEFPFNPDGTAGGRDPMEERDGIHEDRGDVSRGSSFASGIAGTATQSRRVSMQEALSYLDAKRRTAGRIALGTAFCILSPVCLLLMAMLTEQGTIPENLAVGIGLGVLFLLIAVAVVLFVSSGFVTAPFEFLQKQMIEIDGDVKALVETRKRAFGSSYARCNIIGVVLCVLSVIPVILLALLVEKELYVIFGVCGLFLLIAVGVFLFVFAGVRWASFEALLEEGDYSRAKKYEKNGVQTAIATVYWSLVTTGFLAYSFITEDWGRSWIVWPIAGVLYASVLAICNLVHPHNKGDSK